MIRYRILLWDSNWESWYTLMKFDNLNEAKIWYNRETNKIRRLTKETIEIIQEDKPNAN